MLFNLSFLVCLFFINALMCKGFGSKFKVECYLLLLTWGVNIKNNNEEMFLLILLYSIIKKVSQPFFFLATMMAVFGHRQVIG